MGCDSSEEGLRLEVDVEEVFVYLEAELGVEG